MIDVCCGSIWVFPEFKVQIIVQVRFDLCSANLCVVHIKRKITKIIIFSSKERRNGANKDNGYLQKKNVCVCVCILTHVCIYVYMYICMYVVCMYVCMCVRIYVCMYVWMYECMYV